MDTGLRLRSVEFSSASILWPRHRTVYLLYGAHQGRYLSAPPARVRVLLRYDEVEMGGRRITFAKGSPMPVSVPLPNPLSLSLWCLILGLVLCFLFCNNWCRFLDSSSRWRNSSITLMSRTCVDSWIVGCAGRFHQERIEPCRLIVSWARRRRRSGRVAMPSAGSCVACRHMTVGSLP